MTGALVPAGPRGLPLLGNAVPFMTDPFTFLLDLQRTYGDRAGWLLGTSRALLVSHPDDVGEVLTQVEDTYAFPDLGYSFRFLTGEGVATSKGADWRRKRAVVMPAVRPQMVRAYSRIMVDEAVAHVATWRNGDRVDVYAQVSELTRRIAVRAIFGSDPGDAGAGINRALDVAQAQIGADFRGASVLLPDWFVTPGRLRLRRAVATLDAEVARLVREYRGAGSMGENLLSRLVDARDDTGDPLPDKEIRDEAITFYVAGHATTAATITWAVYLLSHHPDTWRALRDEVHVVLGGRVPTHDDCGALPYAEQVVKETLRLYPPSWSLAHIAQDGATLSGRGVRSGTLVFTSPWVTQRDPRWFADPDRFRPDRWADSADLPEHAWFPFGGGPRVCPGARYATVQAILVLAVLVQHVELDVAGGVNPPYPGLTAFPRNPMWATVRRITS